MDIRLRRIYEPYSPDDGYRVLVDRLWPRGVSKERAKLDLWLKEIAPSSDLRTWFGHKPERFAEFTVRYKAELKDNPTTQQLRDIVAAHKKVTLLYGTRDPKCNHAHVIYNYIK